MKKLLSGTAAGAALFLALCGISGSASATTITLVNSLGFQSVVATPTSIIGNVISTSALSYTNDWIEFQLNPATTATVTVDDLANTFFPNETWEITGPGSGSTIVTGPNPADNVPTNVALPGGVDFFLRLASDAPKVVGASSASITITGRSGSTPLPGALVLFAGGLGLLGATGLRKQKKDRSARAVGLA